jgi:hypothetical protein
MERPGKEATFHCSCGRESGCGELRVIPIKVGDEKRVDLITLGLGGVVLSRDDRLRLIKILAQQSWFGED